MNHIIKQVFILSLFIISTHSLAQSNKAANLNELLDLVEQGKSSEAREARDREAQFRRDQGRQQQLVSDASTEKTRQEQVSQQLEQQYNANEVLLVEKREALDKRLGSLKELFGVLQQVSGDTRASFESSIISAQYPGREQFLTDLAKKMGTSSQLASIEEMERLWFEIQREMTESGKVARFSTEVNGADGAKASRDVIRIGSFNLVSDGAYLKFTPETQNIVELPRQPKSRYVGMTSDLAGASTGMSAFGLDPTRGSLVDNLVKAPSIQERIEQGGIVGYIIIGVGIIGLLIALERLLVLTVVGGKVKRQVKREKADTGNPLGRVLKVYEDNPDMDTETLEIKLGEAILREMPRLSRGVTLLKIIFVVAPLLGLLGTVTGMIVTFQQITLFGTGDPQLMAGGISQALMTTVLGLCVAIPIVLLHTIVAGRSKAVTQILQEQSAGIIAEHMEQSGSHTGRSS